MSDPTAVELARTLIPSEVDMVQFVRSGGAGFPTEVLEHVSSDLVVEFHPEALGGQILGTGLTGMVEGWAEWLEPYESYFVSTESVEEMGPGEILMFVRVKARTARDSVTVEHAPAAILTVREGVLVRIRFHLDREEARRMAAAGD
jgi:hypothetical protein